MGDAPAVVRVFWPHPSLPRISSEGGEDARSAGTEDEGPALVLVGWWHANARRGDDADDRDGARPAVSSVDVVVAGAAVSAVSFEDGGRDRGTSHNLSSETLGPPVVLGSLVPPSAARSADSAHPRRAPKPKPEKRKNQSRDDDDDAPFACPVRLLARIGPRNPERGINKSNALERAVRLSYGSFVESDGDEPLVDVVAEARNAEARNVEDFRFSRKSENVEDSRRSYRARVVRYATPNPPGHALGSRDASAPYAWVLRAANEAGRLANARGVNTNDDNARKPREDVRGFTKKQKTKSAFPFFAFPSSTPSAYRAGLGLLCARLARALEVKWVPGLRQRHAWVAPRRRRRASDSDDADSDDAETGDVGDVARPSPFMFRDACELFASAKVIRSRARWFARGDDAPAVPADVGARCPSLRRAALFGRALQILLDLALGFALRSVLLANADALVAFAAGEDAVPPGGRKNARAKSARTPPLGALIRANAEWLMRGSPLGVKLHAPLARALGGAAMTLVEALGVVCSTATFHRFVRACVEAVARAGPVGGASLSLALAADLTTFLSTHVAALHVYSSLLVTGQWHVGKRLALIVARNASVESATFGVLALTPLALLFPTTLAFYLSYLAIHAFTVVARASLVFAAAAAQHAPLEEIVAVCAHPKAFPGTTSVTARFRDGALFLRVDPAGVFETATAPFFSAAARWAAGTLRAVAEACGSLGRLPVALVPFEPDAADLFPDLERKGEERKGAEARSR